MSKKEVIKDIMQKNNIALLYIFGSQVATGLDLLNDIPREFTDPLTDIDIGVVFKAAPPGPMEVYNLYSSIYNQLEDVFFPYPLDLVFLQETHSVFQANAILGRCIYFCSLEFKEIYEEKVLMRAADFRPFLERYLDEVLEEV